MTSRGRKHLGTRYRDNIDASTVASATARHVRPWVQIRETNNPWPTDTRKRSLSLISIG